MRKLAELCWVAISSSSHFRGKLAAKKSLLQALLYSGVLGVHDVDLLREAGIDFERILPVPFLFRVLRVLIMSRN